jgi:hypothetical protein
MIPVHGVSVQCIDPGESIDLDHPSEILKFFFRVPKSKDTGTGNHVVRVFPRVHRKKKDDKEEFLFTLVPFGNTSHSQVCCDSLKT